MSSGRSSSKPSPGLITRALRLPSVAVCLLLWIGLSSAQPTSMRKGPYLIRAGHESRMKILWQLASSAVCRLSWGLTEDCEVGSVVTRELDAGLDGHQHMHTVEGLQPGKRYHYRITENGVDHRGSFLAAPRGNAETVTFYAYGDTRTLPERHDSVLAAVRSEIRRFPASQTFMLHAGDWNTSDEEKSWDMEFFNRGFANLRELPSITAFQGARGNHEQAAENYRKYWPYAYERGGMYYSFDYGPVHVSVLDQYTDYSEGSDQLRWLEKDLAMSGKAWKIILLHEPGFTDESAHPNRQDVQDLIHPLCVTYGVRFVIGGHNHLYARCVVDGVYHLTLGGGGGPLSAAYHRGPGLVLSESTLHFARAQVEKAHARVTIIRADGSVLEEFTVGAVPLACHESEGGVGRIAGVVTRGGQLRLGTVGRDRASVQVLDVKGRTLIGGESERPGTTVDLRGLGSGVYVVRHKRGRALGQGVIVVR